MTDTISDAKNAPKERRGRKRRKATATEADAEEAVACVDEEMAKQTTQEQQIPMPVQQSISEANQKRAKMDDRSDMERKIPQSRVEAAFPELTVRRMRGLTNKGPRDLTKRKPPLDSVEAVVSVLSQGMTASLQTMQVQDVEREENMQGRRADEGLEMQDGEPYVGAIPSSIGYDGRSREGSNNPDGDKGSAEGQEERNILEEPIVDSYHERDRSTNNQQWNDLVNCNTKDKMRIRDDNMDGGIGKEKESISDQAREEPNAASKVGRENLENGGFRVPDATKGGNANPPSFKQTLETSKQMRINSSSLEKTSKNLQHIRDHFSNMADQYTGQMTTLVHEIAARADTKHVEVEEALDLHAALRACTVATKLIQLAQDPNQFSNLGVPPAPPNVTQTRPGPPRPSRIGLQPKIPFGRPNIDGDSNSSGLFSTQYYMPYCTYGMVPPLGPGMPDTAVRFIEQPRGMYYTSMMYNDPRNARMIPVQTGTRSNNDDPKVT